jgi:hypothetical protein
MHIFVTLNKGHKMGWETFSERNVEYTKLTADQFELLVPKCKLITLFIIN